MIKPLTVLIALALCLTSIASAQVGPFDAKASLVEIEITKKAYDYKIPWVLLLSLFNVAETSLSTL